jgi:CheY-like chemotaxis protein
VEELTEVRSKRVLIVEDEYLLALDLSRYFESMGAVVLGPASNIPSARAHLRFADAAVLDIDLNGQKVFPVADELVRRGIPFVFFSGRDDIAIPPRFRHAGLLNKPINASVVFASLFPPEADGSASSAKDSVFSVLPKLRLGALLLMEDLGAADRLVELTLERALDRLDRREDYSDLESWLTDLLQDTHDRYGRDLML